MYEIKRNKTYYEICRCDCGVETIVLKKDLKSGHTRRGWRLRLLQDYRDLINISLNL